MEINYASCFAALGHQSRLDIYRLLIKTGDAGLNIGEIAAHLDVPLSTLAHHLGALTQAGLVIQDKEGRQTRNRADYNVMTRLIGFLGDECCAGVPRVKVSVL